MQQLITLSKQAVEENPQLPFCVYSSIKEQRICNVSISKPALICVLNGYKMVGSTEPTECSAGQFIFLANHPAVEIRNIPEDSQYYALIIEFEYDDFNLPALPGTADKTYVLGKIEPLLQQALQQFVEWSRIAPKELWPLRRQELLQLILHLGYDEISCLLTPPSLSHRIQGIISNDLAANIPLESLCAKLAMSESTLRRKLNAEGTSLQIIKDRARLGLGLHLIQTSYDSIALIAEQCGYHSQSRFTDKFKQLYGVTPSGLRRARLAD